MADYKLITMAVIMLSINVILWLAQGGIAEVAASEGTTAPTLLKDGSPMMTYTSNVDGEVVVTATAEDFEVETADTVDEGTGNLFTDTFKTVKDWFNKQEQRFGIVTGIFSQPYGFMKDSGIPQPICTAFGTIWYVMLTLLIIGFFRGGNQ